MNVLQLRWVFTGFLSPSFTLEILTFDMSSGRTREKKLQLKPQNISVILFQPAEANATRVHSLF